MVVTATDGTGRGLKSPCRTATIATTTASPTRAAAISLLRKDVSSLAIFSVQQTRYATIKLVQL
jgi:hypothetical protein